MSEWADFIHSPSEPVPRFVDARPRRLNRCPVRSAYGTRMPSLRTQGLLAGHGAEPIGIDMACSSRSRSAEALQGGRLPMHPRE